LFDHSTAVKLNSLQQSALNESQQALMSRQRLLSLTAAVTGLFVCLLFGYVTAHQHKKSLEPTLGVDAVYRLTQDDNNRFNSHCIG
jgi:hypothetical protein